MPFVELSLEEASLDHTLLILREFIIRSLIAQLWDTSDGIKKEDIFDWLGEAFGVSENKQTRVTFFNQLV